VWIETFAQWNRSSRQAVFAALVLIGAVAMYNWIVAPHVTYLLAVQTYEPVVDRVAHEKASLKNLLIGRRKMLEDLESQFSRMRQIVYTDEQARQLFGDLGAMAAEHKCTVTTVDSASDRPARIVGGDPKSLMVEPVDTSLTITGAYDGIMAFIGRLLAQPRKIWVRSLTMEPVGTDVKRLRCRIYMGIYVIQEKEAVSHD